MDKNSVTFSEFEQMNVQSHSVSFGQQSQCVIGEFWWTRFRLLFQDLNRWTLSHILWVLDSNLNLSLVKFDGRDSGYFFQDSSKLWVSDNNLNLPSPMDENLVTFSRFLKIKIKWIFGKSEKCCYAILWNNVTVFWSTLRDLFRNSLNAHNFLIRPNWTKSWRKHKSYSVWSALFRGVHRFLAKSKMAVKVPTFIYQGI